MDTAAGDTTAKDSGVMDTGAVDTALAARLAETCGAHAVIIDPQRGARLVDRRLTRRTFPAIRRLTQ